MPFKTSWDVPEQRRERENKTPNFWLRAGETKRIIFLQDAPIGVYEHELYGLVGRSETHVCPKKNFGQECLLCELDQDVLKKKRLWALMVGYSTVIDLGVVRWVDGNSELVPYVDNDGNERWDWMGKKKLFRGKYGSKEKMGTWRILKEKRNRYGSLKFTVWDVERLGEKDARVGSSFEFVTRLKDENEVKKYMISMGIDKEKVKDLDLDVFDYESILKPLSDGYITSALKEAGLILRDNEGNEEDDVWGDAFNEGTQGINTDNSDSDDFPY